jgi:hypothetical protein
MKHSCKGYTFMSTIKRKVRQYSQLALPVIMLGVTVAFLIDAHGEPKKWRTESRFESLIVRAIEPSPAGNPVPPDPVAVPPQNQYVISGQGKAPFVIPCVIRLDSETGIPYIIAQGHQTAEWSLDRSMPHPLAKTGNAEKSLHPNPSYGADIVPQFLDDRPDAATTPLDGMGFSTLNGLPASNDDFGVRVLTHKINGKVIAKSKIAVFYEADATTHPEGGPEGYDHYWRGEKEEGEHMLASHVAIPTPNWIYYYSQVFPTPNGYTINYRNSAGSGSYPEHNPDHIHIGWDAHRRQEVGLYAQVDGVLETVGTEYSRGIDSYIRTVSHECIHMYILKTYGIWPHSNIHPILDGDDIGLGDGVPDDIEDDLGLRPTLSDSLGLGTSLGYEPDQNDQEIVCRLFEHAAADGDANKDWAYDGLNGSTGATGRIPPPNRANRHPTEPEVLPVGLVWPTLPNWLQ